MSTESTPRLVRVNPAGDTPTSVDFRRAQDNTEQALKQLADVSLTWVSAEAAKLFGSGWQNYANGWERVSFAMDRSGRVWLRGVARNPTIGLSLPSLIFSLPAANAPVYDRSFVVNGNGAFAAIIIYGRFGAVPQQAGQVYLKTGSNLFVSLDGVSFEAGA